MLEVESESLTQNNISAFPTLSDSFTVYWRRVKCQIFRVNSYNAALTTLPYSVKVEMYTIYKGSKNLTNRTLPYFFGMYREYLLIKAVCRVL